jgi:hydroxymethylbilane synthase
MSRLRLGTRASALAVAQAEQISAALGGAEIVRVRTDDGAVGDKARFVRGVERALLGGEVDLGVHSAKDLPGELPEGLAISAVPGREESADAFVGAAASLAELPEGARIGTSSLRRRAQLLALRPDLEIVELRGNVDTRLAKLAEGALDGIVLAAAGLRRLGRTGEIAFAFSRGEMTPAPGQGALALEARRDDRASRAAAARIGDEAALTELTAERAATIALGASCHTPIGISAHASAEGIGIEGFAGLPDGSEWVRDSLSAPLGDPAGVGEELASRMLAAGAGELLQRAEALA